MVGSWPTEGSIFAVVAQWYSTDFVNRQLIAGSSPADSFIGIPSCMPFFRTATLSHIFRRTGSNTAEDTHMPLPMNQVTYYEVRGYDLQMFIWEQNPGSQQRYKYVEDALVGGSSSVVTFDVRSGPLRPFEQGQLQKFMRGEAVSNVTYALLCDLCNRGLIPEGDYRVTTASW